MTQKGRAVSSSTKSVPNCHSFKYVPNECVPNECKCRKCQSNDESG